jgi:hypothetical protein
MIKSVLKYKKLMMHIALMHFIILMNSCNKENAPDCFQHAGETKTVRRDVGNWTSIELRDYLQIELIDSAQQFVEIEGPGNLLNDITSTVDNGKLLIRNENTCNFVRSFRHRIHVQIYSPEFKDIQNYCTGDIKSINKLISGVIKIDNRDAAGRIELEVETDTITIASHTGVCDVLISGKSQITNLFNQGVGIVDARLLNTTDAFVNNSSINDVFVNSNGYFYAHIAYSGNIYYSGAPNHIDSDISGRGKIIPLD